MSSLLSILPSAVATGVALFHHLEEMRSAPYDMRELEAEMAQLCPILEQLRDLHISSISTPRPHSLSVLAPSITNEKAETSASPGLVMIADPREENERNLAALLVSCEEVFRATAELLEKYSTEGKSGIGRQMDRLAWSLDGQRKAEKLRKRLETSKSTLGIALGLLTQNKIETAGKEVGLVHKDTQLIISQIQSLIGRLDEEEISSLLAEAPSEHNFMLRRYLESASSYAETICSDFRPFGLLISEASPEDTTPEAIPEETIPPEAIPPEPILQPTLEVILEAAPPQKKKRARNTPRNSQEFATKPVVIESNIWTAAYNYQYHGREMLRVPDSDDELEIEALCTVQDCPRGRDLPGNGFANIDLFNIHMKLTHDQSHGSIVPLPKESRRFRTKEPESWRKRV